MRALLFAALIALPCMAGAEALTRQETKAFAAQIAPCWNIGALSKNAQKRVVTVKFQLDRQARPLKQSFELIGAGKGTPKTTKDAYNAARRAVLRCGAKGFKLPLEKYEQWKDIEMTFNPERMPVK